MTELDMGTSVDNKTKTPHRTGPALPGDGGERVPGSRFSEAAPWGLWLVAGCAWMLGLAAVQFLPRLATPPEQAGAGAAALMLLLALGVRRLRTGVIPLLAFAVGVGWAHGRAEWRLADALAPQHIGVPLAIEGEVTGLPQALVGHGGDAGWRLGFAVERAPAGVPSQLSVTWFPGKARVQAPKAGERWQLTVRLKPVHALQNPGLPDGELWLLERGIRAQGSIQAGVRLAEASPWNLQALREGLREALSHTLADPRARAVMAGLAIGDQAGLSAKDWALLRDTGVVHLFAISGLHITGFAWLAGALVAALWRRSAALSGRWPRPLAARWLGLAAAAAYAVLAGWGVPAQRTVGLMLVLALLHSSARLWPWSLALTLAGAVIGAFDPWALVTPGFWLSFVAVALLMHGGERRPAASAVAGHPLDDDEPLLQEPPTRAQRWLGALGHAARVQGVITLGLAPLSLIFFGQVSVVGLLTKAVAIPWVTWVLTPLALMGTLLAPLWHAGAAATNLLFGLLEAAAHLPGAVWWSAQAPGAVQVLALGGVAAAAWRSPWPLRVAGAVAVLPVVLWRPPAPPQGQFEMTVIDVGQGSAVWVRTAGHHLLFDAGPRWGGGSDAGARVVVPTLRAHGVGHLDALVLSHDDADHTGGAQSVLSAWPMAQRWCQLPPHHPVNQSGSPVLPCQAGQRWVWDGVAFEFLHPEPAEARGAAPKQAPPRDNARSCVLRVQAEGGVAALLTGDIEAAQEAALVAQGAPLQSDVLVVPHHGSKSSSTPAFVAAVQPRWAFAQVGFMNRHGHPAERVRQTYAAQGVPLLTSAACGAWRWSSDEAPGASGCWRVQRRRYWMAAAPSALTPVTGEDGDAQPSPSF
ncbi:DNA internalization-related competence protein ComEC/Rec2 [Inhella gelatinilytica]|uniref:DNA internalization-related competence protein ComEC/Rec2 n=1 Tax=Inhella gelatinilytica TaxID=2795030 RepID=A0A931ND83_9BURK|nr:DNA internalization-related competence protein ComEC/Rec2 [Inhella gelatinilytica]MBH9552812.1 DNA internalization-related competence protein ComEC/Rec2 [Inhella gelatinilytica]